MGKKATQVSASKRKNDGKLEVSVDSPTILAWLIKQRKYEDAMDRLHDASKETKIWLIGKTSESRVLPLHLACRQLKEEMGLPSHAVLCNLISHLLLINPSASRERYFPEKRLPIHDAVAGRIDEETLALILTVYPESIRSVDERQLTLTELNRINTNDSGIQSVIDLGYDEWKAAYDSSPLASGVSLSKMDDLVSLASGTSRGTAWTGLEAEGVVQSSTLSDRSTTVSAPGEEDSVSSLGTEASNDDGTSNSADASNVDDFPIVPWGAIKDRAVALETILSDMKEANNTLFEKIQLLSSDAGKQVIHKVDQKQGTELENMVDFLQHQNFALDQSIYKTETLLHYSVFPADDESIARQQRRGEVAKMLGWLSEDDSNPTGTAQRIHQELQTSYDQQNAALTEFAFVFDSIGGPKYQDDTDNDSSQSQQSAVSNLTMNDEWSIASEGNKIEHNINPNESHFQVEIEWPEDQIDACAVSDNLSTIFRHASMGIEPGTTFDGALFPDESATDNLSQILRTAAKKDSCRNITEGANVTENFNALTVSGNNITTLDQRELQIPALIASTEVESGVTNSSNEANGSQSDEEPPTHPKQPSLVTFGNVSIRVFDRIIGDNPGCTQGPSLGIGWNFSAQDELTVAEYELLRGDTRNPSGLLLSRAERNDILMSLGYTNKEIAANIRELNRARSQRRQTVVNLGVAKLEERLEIARRKVKSIIFLGRRKKVVAQLSESMRESAPVN